MTPDQVNPYESPQASLSGQSNSDAGYQFARKFSWFAKRIFNYMLLIFAVLWTFLFSVSAFASFAPHPFFQENPAAHPATPWGMRILMALVLLCLASPGVAGALVIGKTLRDTDATQQESQDKNFLQTPRQLDAQTEAYPTPTTSSPRSHARRSTDNRDRTSGR